MYKTCLAAIDSKNDEDLLVGISLVANSEIPFRQGQCRNMLNRLNSKFYTWRYPKFFPKGKYNLIYTYSEINLGINRKPTYKDRLIAYCKAIFQIVTEEE